MIDVDKGSKINCYIAQLLLSIVYYTISGDFKIQPLVDRRFRSVVGGCHCLEQ